MSTEGDRDDRDGHDPAAGGGLARFLARAHEYEFAVAVRLVEDLFLRDRQAAEIRFAGHASFEHNPSDVAEVAVDGDRAVVRASYFGLLGANGALPMHYGLRVLERVGDDTRRAGPLGFFDIFHDRLIGLDYTARLRRSLPTEVERHRRLTPDEGRDRATKTLLSLAGVAFPRDGGREVAEQLFAFFGGIFSRHARNATGLERVLAHFFDVAVRFDPFRSRWLTIDAAERSRLGAARTSRAGDSFVSGSQVLDRCSTFGLVLGPLDFEAFTRFLPGGDAVGPLLEIVREYAGPAYDVATDLVLARDDVPAFRLGTSGGTRLGWTTWSYSGRADRDRVVTIRHDLR